MLVFLDESGALMYTGVQRIAACIIISHDDGIAVDHDIATCIATYMIMISHDNCGNKP
jgi:hypothetical protein